MTPTQDDAESAVLAVLARSARRTRLVALLPGIVLGAAALLPTFALVNELQWLVMDRAFVLASGGAAAGVMLGCIVGGHRAGEWLWRTRRAALCRSLAQRHGLSEAEVETLSQIVSGP